MTRPECGRRIIKERMTRSPSIRWLLGLILVASLAGTDRLSAWQAAPVQLTAQEDQQRLMDLLHITSLRRGADGRNPDAPNAANYDESKANPYPNLPDPASGPVSEQAPRPTRTHTGRRIVPFKFAPHLVRAPHRHSNKGASQRSDYGLR